MVKTNERNVHTGSHPNTKRQVTKPGYKSTIAGIKNAVFKYGLAKHAAQYVESEETLKTYIQREYAKGGPVIAELI